MREDASGNDPDFGTMQLSQHLTIDLWPDVPVVTDVKLAQIFETCPRQKSRTRDRPRRTP